MTDQQFKTIVAHLQVMIAILGVMAGVMLAFAWEYLMGVSPGLFGVLVAVASIGGSTLPDSTNSKRAISAALHSPSFILNPRPRLAISFPCRWGSQRCGISPAPTGGCAAGGTRANHYRRSTPLVVLMCRRRNTLGKSIRR
jgi:hypothetical protein